MTQTHGIRTRAWLGLAVLCTGLLPGTCEIRAREALIEGTKAFVADALLDPANLSDLPFEDVTESLTGE